MAEERSGWGRRGPTPYQQFQQAEGIPVNRGAYLEDLHALDVADWPRFGQKGAFVNLAGQEEDDAYVLEIAPGGNTEVMQHLFESTVYVLSGRGATTLWQKGKPKQTVEWQRGTCFAPPLNCRYQHFNLDGQQPARLWALTNAPMVINLFRSPEFVFDCPYTFRERYDVQETYFSDPGVKVSRNTWQTNYIPDVRKFPLDENTSRGYHGFTIFQMSNNSMGVHITEWAPGTYLAAHRHNAGAHLVHLEGQGFSLLWLEGRESERVKVDWKDGTVFSPRSMEYHQHFNTGRVPSRHIAFRLGDLDNRELGFGINFWRELRGIPFECEDPVVYTLYEQECLEHGAPAVKTRPDYARCQESLEKINREFA